MSRRRPLLAAVLALGALLLAGPAAAQSPRPLTATIFFKDPPANLTYDPAVASPALTIILQIENTSGAPVLTTQGFSGTDFWRKVYFTHESGAIATNTAEAEVHGDARVSFCLSRKGVLQVPTAIPVVPVEVLAGPPSAFSLEFTLDSVFQHFPDLKKAPGRWTVDARIPLLAYTTGAAVIDDCDQFPGVTLANVGDAAGVSRQEFTVVSNGLEFFIAQLDSTSPTTTVLQSPAPNGAGWNNQNVTLTLTAADNPGGSGVNHISVSLTGAQTGTQTIAGPSGAVSVTAEGTTTVTFNAVDNENNAEAQQSLTVKIDKTPPLVTPPASITVVATEVGGARGSASPALATFLGAGSAVDNLDQSPARLAPQVGGVDATNSTLFPPGATTVRFRFRDVAGHIGSANSSVTVVAGKPAISGAVVRSGALNPAIHFYDLRFTNTGISIARDVVLTRFSFRTLAGVGNVSYNTSRSPRLPIALGDLAVGASRTIRVFLAVPPPVRRFSITETGQFRDTTGSTMQFSTQQVVSPRRVERDERSESREQDEE